MSLTPEEVNYIAHLAKLEISEAEIPSMQAELSKILDLVATMQQANTDDVAPMLSVLDNTQRLRADKVTETDQHQRYQKNAPKVESDLYLVPQVIEAEG